ncbi:MAG: hypothetical protein ACO1OO_03365 [Flavisolibacter sp.]
MQNTHLTAISGCLQNSFQFCVMLTYLFAWFPMLLLAIANGSLREFFFKKHMNDLAAHQLSTATLIVLFSVYIYFMLQKFPPESLQQALYTGILWMAMTEIFEFCFGLIRGLGWQVMLADYNIAAGRLWLLTPTWLLVAPVIAHFIQARNG